jgi:ubiquinone/menaquinone biosynthesis C-methylase UbiE
MDKYIDPKILQHYENYNSVYYSGALGFFENWAHNSLERYQSESLHQKILDVGGGDGQHVAFVSRTFNQYTILDILDHSKNPNSGISIDNLKKLQFIKGNAEKLPFKDEKFDRVILTCILHHVDSPDSVLKECRRVLRNGGVLSIYLPCDPGLVYRWIRHFMAHMKYAKKTKQNISSVKYLWALEHKNHVLGLSTLIKEIFSADIVKKVNYPFRIGSWNINLFKIYQITLVK